MLPRAEWTSRRTVKKRDGRAMSKAPVSFSPRSSTCAACIMLSAKCTAGHLIHLASRDTCPKRRREEGSEGEGLGPQDLPGLASLGTPHFIFIKSSRSSLYSRASRLREKNCTGGQQTSKTRPASSLNPTGWKPRFLFKSFSFSRGFACPSS